MNDRIAAWVDSYRRAWESNDPADIRAVFTEDALYRGRPNAEPWAGIESIVAGWLEHQDPPGSTSFEYRVLGADGDLAFVQCVTGYPDGPKAGVYDNLWVVELAGDGRASEFTDWWIARSR